MKITKIENLNISLSLKQRDQNKNTKHVGLKIQIDFYCNEVNKRKHKNNITRLQNKIVIQINVEHTKGNWGILPLFIFFGDLFQKNFHHYEKLCPQQLDYPTTRAPKQLIYNYIATVPWKYDK